MKAWTTTRPAPATQWRQAGSCSSPLATLQPGTLRRRQRSEDADAAVESGERLCLVTRLAVKPPHPCCTVSGLGYMQCQRMV